jgi:type VII secretion protein EccB
MQTRREQVHAHRFMTRRLVSALLSGEPETADRPMQRLGLTVLASAMVAVIVFAGVGIHGLRNPGGGRRPGANTLVIERETGARYVVLADGVLHPVLNYASARLILGGAGQQVRLMSRASLSGLPRGFQVGIREAPDTLPARSALVGLPWTVCSAPRSADVLTPTTSLHLGRQPAVEMGAGGGRRLDGSALLVTEHLAQPAATIYVITNGLRMKITNRAVLTVLGLDAVTPVPVSRGLLNVIPAGPDLPPSLPRSGQPNDRGIRLDSEVAMIGQVYIAGGQPYVMTEGGLSPVNEVSARLFGVHGSAPRTITPDAARRALGGGQVPDPLPALLSPHTVVSEGRGPTVCASIGPGSGPSSEGRDGPGSRPAAECDRCGRSTRAGSRGSLGRCRGRGPGDGRQPDCGRSGRRPRRSRCACAGASGPRSDSPGDNDLPGD